MNRSDRRRSLTSEIADETTKKNGFEERRLRRRLKDIEEHALKQRKKRNNEQLEYALENLSLEDMASFNSLTRKILETNFLPPINRNPSSSKCEEKRENRGDVLVERLRGSKMIQKYLKSRKSNKLIRSLSVDSGLTPDPANRKKGTKMKPGPYSAFVRKHGRLVGSFSDAPRRVVPEIGAKAEARRLEEADDFPLRVHFAHSKDESSIISLGYARPQRKIQHDCLSDAIEYKLKLRELERKKSLQELVKDT